MAYINTETMQYPVAERDIRNTFPNTSFSSPFNPPEEYQVVFSVPMPTFDSYTQTCTEETPALTNKGHYEQVYKITDLTGEALEEGQVRKLADATAKALATEKTRVDALWQAATDYERAYISNTAIGLLTAGFITGKPKALAIACWSNELWNGPNGYYSRKASGSTNYDYSDIGPMPYSIPELSAEVYGA